MLLNVLSGTGIGLLLLWRSLSGGGGGCFFHESAPVKYDWNCSSGLGRNKYERTMFQSESPLADAQINMCGSVRDGFLRYSCEKH